MTTAQLTSRYVYDVTVKKMSISERLNLVRLVMDDLMQDTSKWLLSENDAWTEEDYADLIKASLRYAGQSLNEERPSYDT